MATKELRKNKDDRDAISTEFGVEENGLEVITPDNISEGDG
jgi:hypothetical protein